MYGHMQRMEENNEVRAIVDSARKNSKRETKREMGGLRPKGHA